MKKAMTVMDATRIQRYKAELCNLDGTPIENNDPDDHSYTDA